MNKSIIIARSLWLLSWLSLLVLPPTTLSRACLLMAASLLRCFPATGERTRGNSRLCHALTLFLSRVLRLRSCALCLVERPQNADCSDETGVVMPAPPPPPAAMVRALQPVCAYSSFCDIIYCVASAALVCSLRGRASALCLSFVRSVCYHVCYA
jgi:hypothetical protein